MTDYSNKEITGEVLSTALSKARASLTSYGPTYPSYLGYPNYSAPWGTTVDKMSFSDHRVYKNVIRDCRFFYRLEPLANTVINKMVDMSINSLLIDYTDKATKTEKQIYDSLKKDIIKFLRKAAVEYLSTGLVVPEITLTRLNKAQLRQKGIQRVDSLLYPTDMWLRNAGDIEIQKPFVSSKESYFLIIPDETIHFITTGGTYPDGGTDKALYEHILSEYPEFVSQIRKGETRILLDNPLIVKSATLTDSQYPIPYLYPALESFKHKRNIKRMDYSIASRVISAILQVAVGSDDYPLTADQEDHLVELENKFKWRENLSGNEVERVFTLFTNHTVNINWIFPEVEALLAEKKYDPVNRDITVALGFPRILITGETEKSFTSDPEIATLSPLSTMNAMREQLLPIVYFIFYNMEKYNDTVVRLPEDIKFKPINLMSLQLLFEGIQALYESGNISRQSFAEAFGYDFNAEVDKRIDEQSVIDESGLQEFAPVPHSNTPGDGKTPAQTPKKPAKPQQS